MLNSRRAMVAAVFILFVFFLVTRTHDSSSPLPLGRSKTSTSSEASNDAATAKKIVNAQAGAAEVPTSTSSSSTSSNGRPAAAAAAPASPAKPVVQKPMIDMSHMSTNDKLAYAYTYDIQSKFPAYIWQTWKYTPADGEFDFRDQEASWTFEHPGFVHEVITDDVAVDVLRLFYATVPEVLEAYHALPLPVLKADFFRYLILYARGGIYTDIDTYAIQSALNWVPESIPRETIGLVIGIEADPDRPDWEEWYSRRIQFCQWTIQSKPGHPVLRNIITHITEETLAMKKAGTINKFLGKNVVNLTGPAVWTDIIMEYFNDERYFDMKTSKGKIDYHNFTGMTSSKRVGDVVVLPITSFSPGVGQMGAGEDDDEMAFVKHEFQGTWKPESERHIGETQEETQFEEQ